jgi:hypothetical protein
MIGIASAKGKPVKIPIIIQTLAVSFSLIEEGDLDFGVENGVLLTLDAGQHQIVEKYHLQWWSGRKPRDLDAVELLKPSTIIKCLDHYDTEKLKAIQIPAGAGALRHAGPSQLLDISNAGADRTSGESSATINIISIFWHRHLRIFRHQQAPGPDAPDVKSTANSSVISYKRS